MDQVAFGIQNQKFIADFPDHQACSFRQLRFVIWQDRLRSVTRRWLRSPAVWRYYYASADHAIPARIFFMTAS